MSAMSGIARSPVLPIIPSLHATPTRAKMAVFRVKKCICQRSSSAYPVGHLHINLVLLKDRCTVLLFRPHVFGAIYFCVPEVVPHLVDGRRLRGKVLSENSTRRFQRSAHRSRIAQVSFKRYDVNVTQKSASEMHLNSLNDTSRFHVF